MYVLLEKFFQLWQPDQHLHERNTYFKRKPIREKKFEVNFNDIVKAYILKFDPV